MAKTKYILSIDGGGMRGIIPAMVLAEIERRIERPLTDIFYLMAGSDSGGLIVAGLNNRIIRYSRYSADFMVHLFKFKGPHIFADRDRDQTGAEYSDDYLNNILDDNLQDEKFSQTTRNMLITSYDIIKNEPFVMNSWSKETSHIMIKDAVRATLAVPMVFLPKNIQPPNSKDYNERILVCGSLLANNPTGYALGAARKLWPDHKHILLSLGTGRTKMEITLNEAKNFTKKDWIRVQRQIMFSTCHGMNHLLSSIMQSNFIRIEPKERGFNAPPPETDNASEENIKALENEGESTISRHIEVIDKFCKSVAGYVGDDP